MMSNMIKPIIEILSKHGGDFKFDDYLYIHDPLTFNMITEINSYLERISFDFLNINLRNGNLSAMSELFIDLSRYKKFLLKVGIKDIDNTSIIRKLVSSKFKEDIVMDFIIEDYRNSF